MKPDVVFCDIGMPGMDGYAVARAMRSDPALSRALLVALTGYSRPEDAVKARAAGFDVHLGKPATFEQIARVLAHCVSPGRLEERGARALTQPQ
jgi:two-component system CheB/CheR fusion protein